MLFSLLERSTDYGDIPILAQTQETTPWNDRLPLQLHTISKS